MKIQFLGTPDDEPYLFHLSDALGKYKHDASANLRKMEYISEIVTLYKSQGVTHIITTQEHLISKLCSTASSSEQKLNNYAGSLIHHDSGIIFLFINPLKQCVTIPYGKFLLTRYVAKITNPSIYLNVPKFSWHLMESPAEYNSLLSLLNHKDAIATAVDIETRKDLSISSVSYTVILISPDNKLSLITKVMPLPYGLDLEDYELRFYYLKEFNNTAIPKIFQNGKYDCAYFQYYNVPVRSYLWDTQILATSAYCELPKDLAMIGAFYIKDYLFWKNEGDSGNLMDLYYYNALDTYGTAVAFLQWMKDFALPSNKDTYAVNNYLLTFPTIHPNFLMESTGLAANIDILNEVLAEKEAVKQQALENIRASLGEPNYNPASPVQTKAILNCLGCKDLKKADEKSLNRAAFRHPFNHYIIHLIIEYRKAAKLISTYLNPEKLFKDRFLYSLTPVTDTGRNRSGEHAFWTGQNIQNIPRAGGIKRYLGTYPGFKLYESDFAQAESRDTAYITGDTVLIDAVESDKDFHKHNASMFFGVPYDDVDKELRQLGKPVNHGANYLMSNDTLIDSMGLPNVFKAADRLGLPKTFTALNITKHLLSLFAKTYKVVSSDYPKYIQHEVRNRGRLTNPYGFTRICFGDPIKSRQYLRALVAFLPQGTNAQALNKAVVRVFYDIWKQGDNSDNLLIHAQIHDSLLYSLREGHEYLQDQIELLMYESSKVNVTDISGITRQLHVPVDKAKPGFQWADSKD